MQLLRELRINLEKNEDECKNRRLVALVREQFGSAKGISTENVTFKLTGRVFKSVQACIPDFSWKALTLKPYI